MNDIQVLRCIDKCDKIGVDEVVMLLQKPDNEFGANLDAVRANLIGQFLQSRGSDEQILQKMRDFFSHANRVMARLHMITFLENDEREDGTTGFDLLLNMRPNDDETWADGGRPKNITFAIDDIINEMKGQIP